MRTESELKALLTTEEQNIAIAIVENEFATKGNKRSLEEIAESCGMSARNMYNIRQKPEFIEYKIMLSGRMLHSKREIADAQLMKLVEGTSNNGIPSVKGLELYFKLTGALKESITVNTEQSSRPQVKPEEVAANIEALRATIK